MNPSRSPVATGVNFVRGFVAVLSTPRPAASASGACSTRMGPAYARMNRARSPVALAPPPRRASAPRWASATRMELRGMRSNKGGASARERALSVIECELLVLTYHCDSHLLTAIKVDRAKWAPERSIPKHAEQDKIGARRAARQRAKRARRPFCAPSWPVRFGGPAFGVRASGRRDRPVAPSARSDAKRGSAESDGPRGGTEWPSCAFRTLAGCSARTDFILFGMFRNRTLGRPFRPVYLYSG